MIIYLELISIQFMMIIILILYNLGQHDFENKPTSEAIVDYIDDYFSDKSYTKLMILLDNGPDNSGVRPFF